MGHALFPRPFINNSQPAVSTSKDFVTLGGSHIVLPLDRVVIGVICTYVCSAIVFVATATVSMGQVLRLLLILELLRCCKYLLLLLLLLLQLR